MELARLHRELQATMIYVTHDQVEAMTLADKIVVMRDGRIEQTGTPLEIYRKPANAFVAGFVGSPKMNLLDARVTAVNGAETRVEAASVAVEVKTDTPLTAGDKVTLGIRPEHIDPLIEPADGTGEKFEVVACERLGSVSYALADMPDGQQLTLQLDGNLPISAGDRLACRPQPGQAHLFSTQTGQRL
jgi:ABC-type sugar transport system ATPase subunit